MVKNLKRKISILVFLLIGSLLTAGLIALNWMNFQSQVWELRNSFRQEVQEAGWKNFLEGNAEGEMFEEAAYCILKLESDGSVSLIDNRFSGKSEGTLVRYGEGIVEHLKTGSIKRSSGYFRGGIYFFKTSNRHSKYLIVVSAAPAYREVLPFVGVSAVAGGLELCFCCSLRGSSPSGLCVRWRNPCAQRRILSSMQVMNSRRR